MKIENISIFCNIDGKPAVVIANQKTLKKVLWDIAGKNGKLPVKMLNKNLYSVQELTPEDYEPVTDPPKGASNVQD